LEYLLQPSWLGLTNPVLTLKMGLSPKAKGRKRKTKLHSRKSKNQVLHIAIRDQRAQRLKASDELIKK
jgi:hypothetical protein